jgi:hypothetical protein
VVMRDGMMAGPDEVEGLWHHVRATVRGDHAI